jgi:hypothetical protein
MCAREDTDAVAVAPLAEVDGAAGRDEHAAVGARATTALLVGEGFGRR